MQSISFIRTRKAPYCCLYGSVFCCQLQFIVRKKGGRILHIVKMIISIIAVFLCSSSTVLAEDRIPKDVQSFINNGRYYIVKTYELPQESDSNDLTGKSFEQNGIIYNQTTVEKTPLEETETKTAEEEEIVNVSSKNSQLALSKVAAQKEYTDDEGFTGILYPITDSVSFSVNGYTTKSYTASDSKYYYNLPSRDTSNIPKSITSSGISMGITDIQWIDSSNAESGDTAVGGNFTAQAFYSGSYTKQLPSSYTATILYRGEVSRKLVKQVVFKVVYEGEKILLPQNPISTEKDNNWSKIKGFTVARAVCGISFLGILIYFIVKKLRQTRED